MIWLLCLIHKALGFVHVFSAANMTSLSIERFDYTVLLYADSEHTFIDDLFLHHSSQEGKSSLRYGRVYCEGDLCGDRMLPALEVSLRGEQRPYLGEYAPIEVEEFIIKLQRAPMGLQNSEAIQKFGELSQASFVLFYNPMSYRDSDNQVAYHFAQLAKKYVHSHLFFGIVDNRNLWEFERVQFQKTPIVRQYGVDEVYDFSISKFTTEELERHIEKYLFPMVLKLDYKYWNALNYYVKDKMVLISFVNGQNSTEVNYYVNHLRSIMWNFRKNNDERFQMAYVDVQEFSGLAFQLNVHLTPLVVAIDYRVDNRTTYYLKDAVPYDNENFVKLINKVWDGDVDEKYLHAINPPVEVSNVLFAMGFAVIMAIVIIVPCMCKSDKTKEE